MTRLEEGIQKLFYVIYGMQVDTKIILITIKYLFLKAIKPETSRLYQILDITCQTWEAMI